VKFFYDNLFKTGTITVTSEHANFPKENLQRRDFNKAWRSNYGAGSGWGNFYLTGDNNGIRFEEAVGVALTASLSVGTYTTNSLCAEIKFRMDNAGGASTYTATYSDVTNKFTIASDRTGGDNIFKIRSDSDDILDTLGFIDEDHPDAASHTADYVRIHSEERVACDFGGIKDIYGVIIRGHNFSSSAIVRVEFSDDDWVGIDETIPFTIQDDILVLEWDTPKTYRDGRIWIRDWTNSDLYVSMGVPYMGGQFQPERNFMEDGGIDRQDPSNVQSSENGQESSIQLGHFDIFAYTFHVNGRVSTDVDLVTNGGFASDTTGWTAQSSAVLASVAGGQNGNCLRITEGGADAPDAIQDITTVAMRGSRYRISYYEKKGTENQYRVQIWGTVSGSITPATWQTGSVAWTQHFLEFDRPDIDEDVYIMLTTSSLNGEGFTFFFDTVTCERINNKESFDTLFNAVGKSKAFFYCEDPDLPLTTTKYVAINSFSWSGRRGLGLWTLSMQLREQR